MLESLSSRPTLDVEGARRRSFAIFSADARVDWVAVSITLVRLGLVPIMMATFMVLPAVTTAALVMFVAADVHDGILARRRTSDGPGRRALDSTADRLAIDLCLIAAYAHGALPLPLLCAFIARDIFCATLCGHMMRSRFVAIKADWLYRSLNLSVASWAIVAPFVSANLRSWLFMAVLTAGIFVAVDLCRAINRVLRMPMSVHGCVIDAGDLRHRGAPTELRDVDRAESIRLSEN